MSIRNQRRPRGIILLVVLTTLTFFSILLAAYLVFSNQAREVSFASASRSVNELDANQVIDDALMMLIRGTGDDTNPFFGEDLLSDFYGQRDGVPRTLSVAGTEFGATGFAEFRVNPSAGTFATLDDEFAGRVMTFLDHTPNNEFENRSFRIIRSVYRTGGNVLSLVVDVGSELDPTTVPAGQQIWINGIPRNAAGLGFDVGTGLVSGNATPQTIDGSPSFTLPVTFQPNHLYGAISKTVGTDTASDFDEPYDAADFNNWFLSHTSEVDIDGNGVISNNERYIIPSFHRPSVFNYILNQPSLFTDGDALAVTLARSTFRPLPIHEDHSGVRASDGTPEALNARFTGGNPNFALRTPLDMTVEAQVDQLAKALIQVTPGALHQWDVDNDSDGIADSIWMNLNLPLVTSPEGKLLQPLIAPQIVDLSSRLNVNAHHNAAITPTTPNLTSDSAYWAGTRQGAGSAESRAAFRGLGVGPAEIALPSTALENMVASRYLPYPGAIFAIQQPGSDRADIANTLLSGFRPNFKIASDGYSRSVDPFGRGGIAIGRSGELVAAESGSVFYADDGTTGNYLEEVDETVNDPYEMDPSGRSRGDLPLTLDEFELAARYYDYDRELLPQRLSNLLSTTDPNVITVRSASDDTPPTLSFNTAAPYSYGGVPQSLYESMIDYLTTLGVPSAQFRELVAPEIQLGNKLDVNRRLGNGVDDNADGIIDEPGEVETAAFAVNTGSGQTIPTEYQVVPDYTFGVTGVTSRTLLARNLYVLMMAATDGVALPTVDSVSNPALYRARRFAQWAVNAVDYRDPDSIMTRFQYDPNPFDASGWTPTLTVWGCERPDLVFSEAMAFHDVRLRNTNRDNDNQELKGAGTPVDDDTDQVRIPQGSVFLELQCPRSMVDTTDENQASVAGFPQELYTVAGGTATLDLDRTSPDGMPVWRVAFSEPHFDAGLGYIASGNQTKDPELLRNPSTIAPVVKSQTTSFEPDQPDEIDASVPALNIDRYLFFRSFPDLATLQGVVTGTGIQEQEVFFLDSTTTNLQPGQFATIAPRLITNLGSRVPAVGTPPDEPNPQRFQVAAADGVIHYRADGTVQTPALGTTSSDFFTPALPLVAGTFPPTAWAAGVFENDLVGLNVSEPLPRGANYYPQPTLQYDGGTNYPLTDAYLDLAATGNTALDEPLDPLPGAGLRLPVSTAVMTEPALGTVPRYCSAFLQRLANPLLPFDAVTNPYRTMDWMSIDLTVFSGEERDSTVFPGADYTRRSRQKNGFIQGKRFNSLYSYETDFVAPSLVLDPSALEFFSFNGADPVAGALQSSFNFLNTSEATSNPGFVGFFPSIGQETGNFAAVTNHETDLNFSQVPYAQHPWLNREFASHFELLMVPASSQGRLFEEFSVSTAVPVDNLVVDTMTGIPLNPPTIEASDHGFVNGETVLVQGFDDVSGVNGIHIIAVTSPNSFTLDPPANATLDAVGIPADISQAIVSKVPDHFLGQTVSALELHSWNAPFGHLLNFFHNPVSIANRIRLPEFLGVVNTKPRFSGEVELQDPARIAAVTELVGLFSAPFNVHYDNTRQGMINLNTLEKFSVWQGLMQGHMDNDEFTNRAGTATANQLSFETFLANRRGFDTTETLSPVFVLGSPGTPPFNYLPNRARSEFPTMFAGVFRQPGFRNMMPALRAAPETSFLRRADSGDSGLLRNASRFDGVPSAGQSAEVAMSYVRDIRQTPVAPRVPELEAGTFTPLEATIHLDRNRNPFMRYQTQMRMPNLASDNSQTFMIRLTLGFFEVDPNNTASLGQEYREDTGQAQRYRGLFIVDRSIPVGFQPGKDLNSRDVVVFERFYQ